MHIITNYPLFFLTLWLALGGLACAVEGTCHLFTTRQRILHVITRLLLGPLAWVIMAYHTLLSR